jgi:hypothetical protein
MAKGKTSIARRRPLRAANLEKATAFSRRLSGPAHRIVPRTPGEASTLVFHEWAECNGLANDLELLHAAFEGTLGSIAACDVAAEDVPDFCRFLLEKLAALYTDARRIEGRLLEASRVLYHKVDRQVSA